MDYFAGRLAKEHQIKIILFIFRFIFAKYRHDQVLTVSMPKAPATAAQVDLEYPGSAVTLQPLKKVQFGRANQMFCFNPLNGLIHAFHASALDKGKLVEKFRSTVSEIIDEISCLLCRNHRCQHRQCLHLFGAAR